MPPTPLRVPRAKIAILLGVLALTAACTAEPFRYVQASGKITYDDGSLIPAKRIQLKFVPVAAPQDAKVAPIPAQVEVDVVTGAFNKITSHTYGDGLTPGRHKVVIDTSDLLDAKAALLVPREYTDLATTPLEVDTAQSPWTIQVKKP